MTEPLRTDPAAASGAPAAHHLEARIEQLLLAGLDEYFAGRYEQAINIWTRVVFLQRGHGRARAYIERARSAMAERDRESEELLHRGVVAFDAGDIRAARDLLMRAIEDGGAGDEALAVLQRLNRVEAAGWLKDLPSGHGDAKPVPAPQPSGRRWVRPLLLAAVAFGALALGAAPLVSWTLELRGGPVVNTPEPVAEPLPLVRLGEVHFAQAQDLYDGGHLLDALRVLERIDTGDPLRPEADRLMGEIQRQLLAVAAAGSDAGVDGAEPSR